MRTVLSVLKEAQKLISNPSRWTQGTSARDAYGDATPPCGSYAVSWCASGALYMVGAQHLFISKGGSSQYNAWWHLSVALGDDTENSQVIPEVNDGEDGYARIMEGFRVAIARLEAQEALEAIPVAEPKRPEVLTLA